MNIEAMQSHANRGVKFQRMLRAEQNRYRRTRHNRNLANWPRHVRTVQRIERTLIIIHKQYCEALWFTVHNIHIGQSARSKFTRKPAV